MKYKITLNTFLNYRYVTYIFNGLKNDLNWNCDGVIRYSDPCNGCSLCYTKNEDSHVNKKWWHAFVPKTPNYSSSNYFY